MEDKVEVFDEKKNEKFDKIINIILIFFFVSWLGWNAEIVWCFINDGVLANRGTLMGPWVPIYGYSCVFLIATLFNKKVMKSKLCTFLLIMIICTSIEYITSIYLERIYQLRWWDYSKYKFNFQGRVSLETTLLFGISGMFALYIAVPRMLDGLKKFSQKSRMIVATILFIIFLLDNIYCTFHPHIGKQTVINVNDIKPIKINLFLKE